MGLRDILYDYSKVSSVSGVSRIGDQNRQIVARLFWSLVILVGTVMFCIQAALLFKKYFDYPIDVVTKLEFKVLNFPAVTICNINPFNKELIAEGSQVAKYVNKLDDTIANGSNVDCNNQDQASSAQIDYADQIFCELEDYDFYGSGSQYENYDSDSTNTTAETVSETDAPARRKRGTKAKNNKKTKKKLSTIQLQNKAMQDLIYLSLDEGMIGIDNLHDRANRMIMDCSYGLHRCQDNHFSEVEVFKECFTYNYEGKLPSARPGPEFGLRIHLHVSSEDYLKSTDVAGVKVAIHRPGTYPFPATLGYNAMAGARTSFGLTMVETSRLGNPHGNCTNKKEGDMPYFYAGSYTLEGCIDSCLQQKIMDTCGCSHFKYPAPLNTTKGTVCQLKKKDCMISTEQWLLASGDISPENCGCYQPCDEINFKTTISQARYPAVNYMSTTCESAGDSAADCENVMKTDELQVEVYYERLNYQKYKEKPAYPMVSLISDLGGQLGFWLGLSIVALYELVSLVVSLLGYALGCVSKDIELKGSLKKPIKPNPDA